MCIRDSGYLMYQQGDGNIKTTSDGRKYLETANSIRHFSTITLGNFHPSYKGKDIGDEIMPGYPLLISPFFENLHLISLFQVILLYFGLLYLFRVIINKYLIFFTLINLIWIIFSTSWDYHNQPLIESPTISFLMFIIYFLDRYFKDYNWKDFLWFSILFGILISINNRYIIHFSGFLSFLLILKYFERRIKIKHLIYSFLVVTAIMAPWHIRQYFVYNEFVLFSPVRNNALDRSERKDSLAQISAKILNYRDYLLDSVHHPLKDNPKELEEARILHLKRIKEDEEKYLAKKEAGTLKPKEPRKIIYEPVKREIEDNNLIVVGKVRIGEELIDKRRELLGFKQVKRRKYEKVDKSDDINIVKYDVDGKPIGQQLASNASSRSGSGQELVYLNRPPQSAIPSKSSSTIRTNENDGQIVASNRNLSQDVATLRERNPDNQETRVRSVKELPDVQQIKIKKEIAEFLNISSDNEVFVDMSLDSLEIMLLSSSPEVRQEYLKLLNPELNFKPKIASLNTRQNDENFSKSSLRQFAETVLLGETPNKVKESTPNNASIQTKNSGTGIAESKISGQENLTPKTSEELSNRGLAALIEKERNLQSSGRAGSVSVQNQTSDTRNIKNELRRSSTSELSTSSAGLRLHDSAFNIQHSEFKTPQLAVLSPVREMNPSGRNAQASEITNRGGITRNAGASAGLTSKPSAGDISSSLQPQTMSEKEQSLQSSSSRPGTQTDRTTASELKAKSADNKNITPRTSEELSNRGLAALIEKERNLQSSGREGSVSEQNQTSDIRNIKNELRRSPTSELAPQVSDSRTQNSELRTQNELRRSSTSEFKSPQLAVLSPVREMNPSGRNAQASEITNRGGITRNAGASAGLTGKPSSEDISSRPEPQTMSEKEQSLLSSSSRPGTQTDQTTASEIKPKSTDNKNITPRTSEELSNRGLAALIEKERKLQLSGRAGSVSVQNQTSDTRIIKNELRRSSNSELNIKNSELSIQNSEFKSPQLAVLSPVREMSPSGRNAQASEITNRGGITRNAGASAGLTSKPSSGDLSSRLQPQTMSEKEQSLLSSSSRPGTQTDRTTASEIKPKSTDNKNITPRTSEELSNRGLAALIEKERKLQTSGREGSVSEQNQTSDTRNIQNELRRSSTSELAPQVSDFRISSAGLRLQNSELRTQNEHSSSSTSELNIKNSKLRTQNSELKTQNSSLAPQVSDSKTHNSEFKTQHSEKLAVLSPVREMSPSGRTNSSNTTKTSLINPTNRKVIQTTTANSQNISLNNNQNKQSTNNKPNLFATSTTMKDRAKVIGQEGNKQLKELIKKNNGEREQLTVARTNVAKDSIKTVKPGQSVILKSDNLAKIEKSIYQAPVIKLDTQVVITKKVVNKPVLLADASSSKPQYKRSIITDTLVIIKKQETAGGIVKVNNPQKEKVTYDTMPSIAKSDFIKSEPKKFQKPVVNYQDENFSITIQDMKVQSVRVMDFDDELEFRKFENLRVRKMVPTYDAIIEALLKSHPKFGATPEKLESFLADFTYSKYKQLVYEKYEPSNKYDLIWNRFKEQFVFYRTDFRLTPQWDPRIYFPSHYNNFINWMLELIMVPIVIINIIPLFIAMYKRDWLIISLAALVFLHILLHALVGYLPRYRITIYPVWITFAVYGYDQITRYLIHLYKNRSDYRRRISTFLLRNPRLGPPQV